MKNRAIELLTSCVSEHRSILTNDPVKGEAVLKDFLFSVGEYFQPLMIAYRLGILPRLSNKFDDSVRAEFIQLIIAEAKCSSEVAAWTVDSWAKASGHSSVAHRHVEGVITDSMPVLAPQDQAAGRSRIYLFLAVMLGIGLFLGAKIGTLLGLGKIPAEDLKALEQVATNQEKLLQDKIQEIETEKAKLQPSPLENNTGEEIQQLQKEIDILEKQISSYSPAASASGIIENLRSEIEDNERNLQKRSEQVKSLESSLSLLQTEKQRLKEDVLRTKNSSDSQTEKEKQLKNEISMIKKEINDLSASQSKFQNEILRINEEIQAALKEKLKAEKSLAAAKTELEKTKNSR